tara:strand:- start:240 stop:458 length:219 start_codon:yes stop_codon:yes gene_type:complete
MPFIKTPLLLSPFFIGKNILLGLNSIVDAIDNYRKNSFCISNSLLMNKFSANSYIHGQPAKEVLNRFDSQNQ